MINLRPQQLAGADKIEEAYRSGMRRPLADMCVGSGKSLTMAELARRAWEGRGERSIILAHTRELVEQNAIACRSLGLQCGVNAEALGERCWRAPVISASIQSVYNHAHAFGELPNIMTDEAHMTPHSEAGRYRKFFRHFPNSRGPGFSGTVFRLQGGSLIEGEGAPFEDVVYTYSIVDGINDGYLVPAFSGEADDKIDVSKLKRKGGEYTADSQDAQMFELMDSHIAQMVHYGANRRSWLVFEASVKAANAMVERLQQWGIDARAITDQTSDIDRMNWIAAFKSGALRCLVNVATLTTGFDAQCVDMLVMRRRTLSLGLYIQIVGRLLRTIGGNIEASIRAGKMNGLVLDFAGNIDQHGPLDFLRPKLTESKLVSCESCGARNGKVAMQCWSCESPMQKICPGCMGSVNKGVTKCDCGYDMSTGAEGGSDTAGRSEKLFEQPSGAALIAAFSPVKERAGGWIPIKKAWLGNDDITVVIDANEDRWEIPAAMAAHAKDSRWVRGEHGAVQALMKINGTSRSTALLVSPNGMVLPVPMPSSI